MPKKAAAKPKQLKIELYRSINGRKDSHIATAISLGLKRPRDVTVQPDNEATRGKLAHIGYLVRVTEL